MPRIQSHVLRLKHLAPSTFLEKLAEPTGPKTPQSLIPKGIALVAPNDPTRELRIEGTPSAIEELLALARLLDLPARRLRLTLTLGAENARATIEATHNTPCQLSVFRERNFYQLQFMPHLNGDGTLSLLKLSASLPLDSNFQQHQRIRIGEPIRFTWLGNDVTLTAALLPE
jgi:hypothetical protein